MGHAGSQVSEQLNGALASVAFQAISRGWVTFLCIDFRNVNLSYNYQLFKLKPTCQLIVAWKHIGCNLLMSCNRPVLRGGWKCNPPMRVIFTVLINEARINCS